MTWAFQLVVALPAHHHLTGDGSQVWALSEPVGEVHLSAAGETLDDAEELTFRSGGYDTPDSARNAGELLRGWIRLTSALDVGGFDVGKDILRSGLGDAYRSRYEDLATEQGDVLVDDVHGLVVYEQQGNPIRLSFRANLSIAIRSQDVYESLKRSPGIVGRPLTASEALACDLVSLVEHEPSARSRLLLLVTAAEALAVRAQRSGQAAQLVEEFLSHIHQVMASADGEERDRLESLAKSAEYLRDESIGASVRALAERARPGEPGSKVLAMKAYKCRSQLVHSGESQHDPATLWPEFRDLVRDMIRVTVRSPAPGTLPT